MIVVSISSSGPGATTFFFFFLLPEVEIFFIKY